VSVGLWAGEVLGLGEGEVPCRAAMLERGLARDYSVWGWGGVTYFQNMGLNAIENAATEGRVVSWELCRFWKYLCRCANLLARLF